MKSAMNRFALACVAAAAVGVVATAGSIAGETTSGGVGPAAVALTPAQASTVEDSAAKVTVRGVLLNAGTNYFTDQRIVLSDPAAVGGKPLDVQGWLPTSVLRPQRSGAPAPDVMSNYIGKEIELTGRIELRPVRGQPPAKTLIVEKAELVKK